MPPTDTENNRGSNSKLRVGIIQRVLPEYRVPFFNKLSSENLEVQVFAGNADSERDGIIQGFSEEIFTRAYALNRTFFPFASALTWQSGVISWLKDFDPEVLVIDINLKMISNYPASRWMHKRRRPVLGWGLGLLPKSKIFSFAQTSLYKWRVGLVDGMIAYGKKAAGDYRTLGVDPNRIFIASNAVAPPSAKAPVKDETVKIDYSSESPIKIIFVGRLIATKNIDFLIRAVANLECSSSLIFVGEGPEQNRLQLLCTELGVDAEFLGYKSGEDLSTHLYASDIFVLPGAGGLAIQEAMAHGLPIIATFADGTEQELVRDGKNGYLLKLGDVDAITCAIAKLEASSELRQQMSVESKKIIENEINIENMSAQFANAVRSVHHGFRSPSDSAHQAT
jgi:glycosyltransferase involved in cell wall biosynthesis